MEVHDDPRLTGKPGSVPSLCAARVGRLGDKARSDSHHMVCAARRFKCCWKKRHATSGGLGAPCWKQCPHPLFPFQLANFPQSPGTPSGLTARTMVRCTGHIACARIAPCRAGAKGPGRAEATPLLRPRPFGRGRLRRGPSLVPATLHLARTTTAARTILSDAGAQDPVYRVHDPSGMRNPVPRNPTYPT